MLEALRQRHAFFAEQGCKLSDHGIEQFYAEDYTEAEVKNIFNKVYGGKALSLEEVLKYRSAMLIEFAFMDWEADWTQQFHYGALRNNNSRMLSRFVGMLTDSRSFLSYPRHEYFRRTLCNLLGTDVEQGELPISEMPRLCQMVEDICYYNAKHFFQFS